MRFQGLTGGLNVVREWSQLEREDGCAQVVQYVMGFITLLGKQSPVCFNSEANHL